MKKAGKVINIKKNKIFIITTNNEFVTIEKHSVEPKIGELYAGEEFSSMPIWKYFMLFFCILILLVSIRKLYLDSKYNFYVIVDMNCTLKMEVNSSNKIKKVEGISPGGYHMKQMLSLEHESLEEALHLILDESIKQKFLTKAHSDDGYKITIFVFGNKNNPIKLTEFKAYASTHNFKVAINNGQVLID